MLELKSVVSRREARYRALQIAKERGLQFIDAYRALLCFYWEQGVQVWPTKLYQETAMLRN
ncbi:MAG: hypothetical protein JWN18_502 [Parcubacteria group bacterium]|nr:hypothetical protein [Parcubacteria group bacterium]